MSEREIGQAIVATAEMLGHTLSDPAVRMFVKILEDYPDDLVQNALLKCATELKGRRLTPAEVIDRIDDGRPGAQQAWALVPRDEETTVVWTGEMRTAHAAASQLQGDEIAARMAFIEVYNKEVTKARSERRPIKWVASLGTDQHQKETALREAVEQGKMTLERARHFLPFGNFVEQTPQLGSDTQDQKQLTEDA